MEHTGTQNVFIAPQHAGFNPCGPTPPRCYCYNCVDSFNNAVAVYNAMLAARTFVYAVDTTGPFGPVENTGFQNRMSEAPRPQSAPTDIVVPDVKSAELLKDQSDVTSIEPVDVADESVAAFEEVKVSDDTNDASSTVMPPDVHSEDAPSSVPELIGGGAHVSVRELSEKYSGVSSMSHAELTSFLLLLQANIAIRRNEAGTIARMVKTVIQHQSKVDSAAIRFKSKRAVSDPAIGDKLVAKVNRTDKSGTPKSSDNQRTRQNDKLHKAPLEAKTFAKVVNSPPSKTKPVIKQDNTSRPKTKATEVPIVRDDKGKSLMNAKATEVQTSKVKDDKGKRSKDDAPKSLAHPDATARCAELSLNYGKVQYIVRASIVGYEQYCDGFIASKDDKYIYIRRQDFKKVMRVIATQRGRPTPLVVNGTTNQQKTSAEPDFRPAGDNTEGVKVSKGLSKPEASTSSTSPSTANTTTSRIGSWSEIMETEEEERAAREKSDRKKILDQCTNIAQFRLKNNFTPGVAVLMADIQPEDKSDDIPLGVKCNNIAEAFAKVFRDYSLRYAEREAINYTAGYIIKNFDATILDVRDCYLDYLAAKFDSNVV